MTSTERARDERLVRRVIAGTYFDSLTKLFNRPTFVEAVDVALHRARAGGRRAAVIHVDIDQFARLQQFLGGRAGDAVLVEFAHRLATSLQASDLVARGGDASFLVFLDLAEPTDTIEPRMARALASLAEPVAVEGHRLAVKVNAGAALFPEDGRTAEDLIRAASVALDAAHSRARGVLHRFDAAYDCAQQASTGVMQRLLKANVPNDFDLAFEPLIDCATGVATGAETLLRWTPEDGVPISPSVFVPLAERSGAIVEIGRWVLQRAFTILARWQTLAPRFRLAINVSARQLQESDFVDTVVEAADAADIALDTVILELTETALLADVDLARRTLEQLVAGGASLAIDDFGTGNATLATLQDLPVSMLKIDRRFVSRAPTDRRSRQLVGACVGIAEHLGLVTVAEGVETAAQMDVVRQLRCDMAQGYMFTRSLAAEAFERHYVRPLASPSSLPFGGPGAPYPGGRRRAHDPAARHARARGSRP
ncbi:MAG: putative bifunctional diguanylate cyclase/phosphodiesterase [Pseudomonadota bacterium]